MSFNIPRKERDFKYIVDAKGATNLDFARYIFFLFIHSRL